MNKSIWGRGCLTRINDVHDRIMFLSLYMGNCLKAPTKTQNK